MPCLSLSLYYLFFRTSASSSMLMLCPFHFHSADRVEMASRSQAGDSIAKSSLVVPTAYDQKLARDRAAMQGDASYMRKIQRTLCDSYVERSANGVVALNDAFRRLDRSLTEENFEANIWQFKTALKDSSGLNDRQLDVLFDECLTATGQIGGGGGGNHEGGAGYGMPEPSGARSVAGTTATGEELPMVDLAEVLVLFRKMFGGRTQQFHDVLKKLRAKRLDIADSPFALHERGVSAAPSRLVVYEYLTGPLCRLTESEAFLVLEYCNVPPVGDDDDGGDGDDDAFGCRAAAAKDRSPMPVAVPSSVADGELDADYLVSCVFAFPMPDDIAYPLLIGKFADSLADPANGPKNGSVGLAEALARHPHHLLAAIAAVSPVTSPVRRRRRRPVGSPADRRFARPVKRQSSSFQFAPTVCSHRARKPPSCL